MWNEPSDGIPRSADPTAATPQPAVVDSVEPGSIGEELGFQPGDRLIAINGVRPRDLIDLRMLCGEEELLLEVEDPDGSVHQVELEKDADDGLGLGFTEALLMVCASAPIAAPSASSISSPLAIAPAFTSKTTITGSVFSTAPISP